MATTIPIWCALVARGGRGPQMARLVAACGARGLPAHPLHPGELAACLRGPRERHPAVVLLRLPSGGPADELAVLYGLDEPSREPAHSQRDGMSCAWINRVRSVARAHDKAACLATLASAGLPVPPTRVLLRDDHAPLGLPGTRFVVKPLRGASGHGVTMGLGPDAALARARAFADLTGGALVQPMLGEGVDHRLFVAGGRVLAGMRRRPAGPAARASLHYGGRAEAWSPSAGQCRLALAAAGALRLSVAGVDLLIEQGRDVLIEVNSCPGLLGIESGTGIDVAGALADLALRTVHER